jgi:hypothetical protein
MGGRRSLLESLSIPVGYGVELATLIDTAARFGLDAVAQVDLDCRGHHHQADRDLAVMAAELMIVAERRRPAGLSRLRTAVTAVGLQQFARSSDGRSRPVWRPVPVFERPPAWSVRNGQLGRCLSTGGAGDGQANRTRRPRRAGRPGRGEGSAHAGHASAGALGLPSPAAADHGDREPDSGLLLPPGPNLG